MKATFKFTLGRSSVEVEVDNPEELTALPVFLTTLQECEDTLNDMSPTKGADSEIINVTEIIIEAGEKGRLVKVRGGAFQKFGVPLYMDSVECAPEWKARLTEMQPGSHKTKAPIRATIQVNDGKAIKVLKLG